jgi:hypothetical protein
MTEWLLAFDPGCRTCGDVIGRVKEQVEERLTLAGLAEPRIAELRRRALGERPRFAPTLIAVDGDRVRAWTGPRLSVRLARLLGPARSVAVLRALNRADVVVNGSRRGLLKAVPLAALGAFVVSGGLAAPAMAAPGRRRMTTAEVEAAVDRLQPLPSAYAEVTAQPMAVRRAVYARLTPTQQAALWREQLDRYRSAHPELTGAQAAVVEQALALIPAVFGPAGGTGSDRLDQIKETAVAAFGPRTAATVFGTLGPLEQPAPAAVTPMWDCGCDCDCNPDFTPCDGCGEVAWTCRHTYDGCGWFYKQSCTGACGGA